MKNSFLPQVFVMSLLLATGCNDPVVEENQRGNYFFESGQFQEAKASYHAALRHEKCPPGQRFALHFNLGNTYCQLRDYEQAKFHYQEAEKIDPQDLDLRFNIACLYARLNQTDHALKLLQEYVKQRGDDYQGLVNLTILEKLRGLQQGGGPPAIPYPGAALELQQGILGHGFGPLPLNHLFDDEKLFFSGHGKK